MALHVWSVLCQKAIVDKETNTVSLLDIIESLAIEFTVESRPENAKFAITASFQFATFWTRSVFDEPEKSRAKVTLYSPRETLSASNVFEIDLTGFSNSRNIVKIPGISIGESGRHWFVVEQEEGSDWVEVS